MEQATRLIVFPGRMSGVLQVPLSSHQPVSAASILDAQDMANWHTELASHSCMHASQVQLLHAGLPTRTSPL